MEIPRGFDRRGFLRLSLTVPVLAANELLNRDERSISLGSIAPLYDENLPSLPIQLEGYSRGELGIAAQAALLLSSIGVSVRSRRRFISTSVLVGGVALSGAGSDVMLQGISQMVNGIGDRWKMAHEKGPMAITATRRVLGRLATLSQQEEELGSRVEIELNKRSAESFSGYSVTVFDTSIPIPVPFRSLCQSSTISVAIGPASQDEVLSLPAEFGANDRNHTVIAASPKKFFDAIGSHRLMITGGAARHIAIAHANMVVLNGYSEQAARDYVDPSIPYSWINNLMQENPSSAETRRSIAVAQRAVLSEFRHEIYVPIRSGSQNLLYQPQYSIDNAYRLHGSSQFQDFHDSTLNLVARVKDNKGDSRVMFISGNWWWNVYPESTASLLRTICDKSEVTLQQAYCVDTGGQTGFVYRDGRNNLRTSPDANLHTMVAAISV